MSCHIGAKPAKKEPVTSPAPATGGLLEAAPYLIGEPATEYKLVEAEPAEPEQPEDEPAEAPKKVTKRSRATTRKTK